MGKEKRKNKDQARRKREAERRPASSDTADLDSASSSSKAQRDDYDEAGPQLEDAHAYIINVTHSNFGNELVINRGFEDGVVVGMFGHITDGGTKVGEFEVTDVRAANCTAKTIDTSYVVAEKHKDVVLNPSID
jgi:cell shape-determining protein MreC